MRTKKAIYNSVSALFLQLITVVIGLILPRLIIEKFGSEVNGTVSSITQFLSYITLLEAGVGGVTRAALYKPLAINDSKKISGIFNATESFFKKIAAVLIVYSLFLGIFFNKISNSSFSWWYNFTLVVIIAIGLFIQYFFGITSSVVMQADQRNYLNNILQIVTVTLNAVVSIILLKLNFGIHIIKFVSMLVYTIKPFVLNRIVNKKFKIDKSVPDDNLAIKQRWNGFGQHIAYFIQNNTDMVVITTFLGLYSVSVYSVYFMVVSGIKSIVSALIGGTEAIFGNMIAKREYELLNKRFKNMEVLGSILILTFFTTTGFMIKDFVAIYIPKNTETNYLIANFGILFAISGALHAFTNLYNSLVLSAGHYKETQASAFIEAGLNIVLSIIFVKLIGINGVLLGSIIAASYRLVFYAMYLRNTILNRKISVSLKQSLLNFGVLLISYFALTNLNLAKAINYYTWVLNASISFVVTLLINVGINFLFNKEDIVEIKRKFVKR